MRYLLLHGFSGGPESPGRARGAAGLRHAYARRPPRKRRYWRILALSRALAALGRGCGASRLLTGGRFALGILARYPERFAHSVIVSAHPGLATAAERDARRAGDARLVELLRGRGLTAFVDHWQALPLWASQAELSSEVKAAQRQLRLRHDPEGLAQSLVQHGLAEMPDLRPHLAEARGEVDVLVGERDLKFVPLGQELSKLISGAKLTIAPGAGHNLLLERPALCAGLLRHGDAP